MYIPRCLKASWRPCWVRHPRSVERCECCFCLFVLFVVRALITAKAFGKVGAMSQTSRLCLSLPAQRVVHARSTSNHKQTLSNEAAVYSMILDTTPAPTVRPPSRRAKRRPSCMATGWISEHSTVELSPGMTISVPSGRMTSPVTSATQHARCTHAHRRRRYKHTETSQTQQAAGSRQQGRQQAAGSADNRPAYRMHNDTADAPRHVPAVRTKNCGR